MGPRLVSRGWGGGLLRRDNVDKRKRKKRLIRLQVLPYRSFFTGLISPVSQYLWVCTCQSLHVERRLI
jgi:hypothetical protein